jgi:hypothetical protein
MKGHDVPRRAVTGEKMRRGTVTFQARIKDRNITFPVVEFTSNERNIEKVMIEGPNGEDICATVHIASVASPDDGKTLAEKVFLVALDRIVFHYDVAIESSRCTGKQFSSLNPSEGFEAKIRSSSSIGATLTVNRALTQAQLKPQLAQPSLPGERNYGLFRAARQSQGHVEEFMHLYHILLMLRNDSQSEVDRFIEGQDPGVLKTLSPHTSKMETVYTRLRNEFSHKRDGVDLDRTKSEMRDRLRELMSLMKQAIEQYS